MWNQHSIYSSITMQKSYWTTLKKSDDPLDLSCKVWSVLSVYLSDTVTCKVKRQKHDYQVCLWSHGAMLMLCVDNFSNQVDEEARRVNWEHTGVATSVKLYLRCIKPQRACLSVCVRGFDEQGDFDVLSQWMLNRHIYFVVLTGSETCQKVKKVQLSSWITFLFCH